MIERYEIKKINNEEILFLYFNFDYEFASLGIKTKKRSLKKIIKDYIKENNIFFKGSAISIVVGGMFLGNITLNSNFESMDNSYSGITSIPIEKVINYQEIENINNKKKEIETIKKETNDVKIEKNKINIKKDDTQKNKKSSVKENTTTSKKSATSTNKSQTTKTIETSTKDNNTYVKVRRSSGEIVTLELEKYLIGVVATEMPALFHTEALKAQAVVARTYTLKAMANGKTLTDNVSTQTYKNDSELKELWGSNYNSYYNKVKKAVDSTKGEYLTYNGKYIEAVYHSTSNGKTESSSYVWGNDYPYLVSVDSIYDNLNPSFSKTTFVSYEDMSKKMKLEINKDTEINISGKTIGDRVQYVFISNNKYTGVEFRNLFGLRSADFTFERKDNGINITTKGYGHGVGMSQYGANGMAKNGSTYKEILKHYYKGVNISKT